SFGGLLFAVGDTAQTVISIMNPGPAASVAGTVQTACFVAGCGWIVWVMLNYPMAARPGRERLRFWMDAATALVAAAVFSWMVTVKPEVLGRDIEQLVEVALA